MFTASGLLVRFLKVFEKGNYQSVKVSLIFGLARSEQDADALAVTPVGSLYVSH